MAARRGTCRIPPVAFRQTLPAFGKASIPWLLEGLLIVFSVVLGFWVNQWQQTRADREYADRVLESLHAEVRHNIGVLEPYVAMHRTWAAALNAPPETTASRSAFDVFRATRPRLPDGATSFPSLRRSSWDAAVSGDALRLIDHGAVAALSDIYRGQELVDSNILRLSNGVLNSPAIFDPVSRPQSVRLLWLTVADIQSAEVLLLDRYRRQLPTIAAAIRARP
jgi:hypothetical protein